MNTRIRRLGVGLLALYLLLFVQLNRVQFVQAEALKEDPRNIAVLLREFGQDRGQILTADGVVAARSVPTPIDADIEFRREYPTGERYAHVVGFQSFNQGAFGLEREYHAELAGTPITQKFTSIGDLFDDRDSTGTLVLTLRDDVQQAAVAALGDRRGSVVALDPRTGAVIAMWTWPSFDPNPLAGLDGASVNAAYRALLDDPDDPLLAKAYRENFFPGSTFKLITAAAGVQAGVIGPTSPVFAVNRTYEPIPAGSPIRNFGGSECGGDLREILRVSCNTAFAEMGAEWVGPDPMVSTAENFGFNATPPIDLPGAAPSRFPDDYGARLADVEFYRGSPDRDDPDAEPDADPDADPESLPNGSTPIHENSAILAQTSIGQNDVKATPLQMALVAAAIANDGMMMKPYVVAEIRAADGDVYERTEPDIWRIATSAGTAAVLRDAMVDVAAAGTARNLAVPGLEVGGKTGTAQLGTDPPDSHAWIVGFAGPPGLPPELVVAVIVEAQAGASEQTGGTVAAPVARAVIEAAFRLG